MRQYVSMLLVIVAVLGLADASYLTYEKFAGVIPACGDGFDCGTVVNSQYGSVGPIPLSVLGMFYYASVLAVAVMFMTEVSPWSVLSKVSFIKSLSKSHQKILKELQIEDLLVALTSIGMVVSAILIGLMAFVIESWCSFCLLSAASSTTLFLISLYALHKNRENSLFFNFLDRGN